MQLILSIVCSPRITSFKRNFVSKIRKLSLKVIKPRLGDSDSREEKDRSEVQGVPGRGEGEKGEAPSSRVGGGQGGAVFIGNRQT